jgi:hypothetical protein
MLEKNPAHIMVIRESAMDGNTTSSQFPFLPINTTLQYENM